MKDGYAYSCCFGSIFLSTHPCCLGNITDFSLGELLAIKKEKTPKFYPECNVCSERRYYIDPETRESVKRMVKVKDYAEK